MESDDLNHRFEELRRRSPELDRQIRESEPRRQLAASLLGLRRAAGFTQVELANALGCTQEEISVLESSNDELPLMTLARYIDACRRRIS